MHRFLFMRSAFVFAWIFLFLLFFFEIDEIRGMRRGGLNGWTRRRMMAGKERSLSDQSCCSD